MEKDYVPKHKPVEKNPNTNMKQQAPAQHNQQNQQKKENKPQQNNQNNNQQKPAQNNQQNNNQGNQNNKQNQGNAQHNHQNQASKPASSTPQQGKASDTKPSTSATQNTASSTPKTQTPAGDTPKPVSNAPKTETPKSTSDNSAETKAEPKKPTTVTKIVKKDFAEARGIGLHASKKYCMYICTFIKGKTVDKALKDLGDVLLFKRAIPMKGEIPHRSEPGMMSGRYPVKTVAQFITMLKSLRGNVIVNGLDVHKAVITMGSASWGSRPAKRGGARFKRTNVTLRVGEKN